MAREPLKLVVRWEHADDAGYYVTFPFDQRLVDLIHRWVPEERRRFDRESREWWIGGAYDMAILRWASREWASFDKRKRPRHARAVK